MKKLVNAKTFIIPCMRAGLCQYDDERVNVPNETLEKMKETAYGIPLIIDHLSQDELEANLETVIVGRVADMHYDEKADLWMAHCVAETEDAISKLESGWGVSTSYEVLSKGAGGTLNAVDYDATIEDGKYLHLAIVKNPRYEMAVNPTFYNSAELTQELPSLSIMTDNESKGEFSMFKLFRTKREEVKENSSDVEIEVDGEKVSLNALVDAYKKNKMTPVKVEHMVDDEKMNEEVEELLSSETNKEVEELLSSVEIEVGEPEEEEPEVAEQKYHEEKEVMPDEMKNEEEEEKEQEADEKDEEKMNALTFEQGLAKSNERFNSLKEASFKSILDNGAAGFQTLQERAALGRSRYGSKK